MQAAARILSTTPQDLTACIHTAGLFERAISLDKSWEKGYFSYAVYLDQLMRDARQRQTALTAVSRGSAKPMDRLGGRSRYHNHT